ncbi:MAG: branched-chain amino acid ABC transporter permease [Candidatus Omnitrophica bacterium]|nr:branched-chain amino acid ABC transporter permease [Candidatus Omnitrophota bacterium]
MNRLRELFPWSVIIIAFLLILFLPVSEHKVHLTTRILIFGLYAIAFNILFGMTGLLSLGSALFYGFGAYVTGMMTKSFGGDYFIYLLLFGAFSCFILAVPLGLLCLRLTDVYFTMLTFAFGQLAWGACIKLYYFTGGDDGIQGIPRMAILESTKSYYLFVFLVVFLSLIILWKISKSPFGQVLNGIRQNRNRITFLGLNVYKHQFLAFLISAFFTGLSGGLYSGLDGSIHPNMFFWTQSGSIILMVILGGINSFFGPLIGSIIFILLEDYIGKTTEYWPFFLGTIMLIIVILFPKGILGTISNFIKGFSSKREIGNGCHS